MKLINNHNMWFLFSLLSLVLIAPFGAINSWIAVLAIIISGVFFTVWYIKEKEGEGKVKISNVIHPGHYNIPGRKECIEEMVDKFGKDNVAMYCDITAYKYQYRQGKKPNTPAEQDKQKAKWYLKKAKELRGYDEGRNEEHNTSSNGSIS